MVPNPAYAQWQQQAMAWIAEKRRREQEFLGACALIRGDALPRFKIDIEADSTIAADEQAEKQSRTEFLTAITPFLEVVIPGLMANPALAPLAKELGLFAVRAFKVARPLEDSFEEAFDRLEQQAAQNPQTAAGAAGKHPGGNTKSPQEIAAEAQETQAKTQVQAQANQVKLVQSMTEAQIERERLAAEQERASAELALRGREMQGREALDVARMQHMAARDTQGLV